MAVTLTVGQLVAALPGADNSTATRLLPVVSSLVEKAAPGAPDAVANEAAIRVAGYIADSPGGVQLRSTDDVGLAIPRGPSSMRASGALALLSPWRIHGAGICDPAGVPEAPPSLSMYEGEVRVFQVAASAQLLDGQTVDSIDAVTLDPTGPTVANMAVAADGETMQFSIGAATAGTYGVRVRWTSGVETLITPAVLEVRP